MDKAAVRRAIEDGDVDTLLRECEPLIMELSVRRKWYEYADDFAQEARLVIIERYAEYDNRLGDVFTFIFGLINGKILSLIKKEARERLKIKRLREFLKTRNSPEYIYRGFYNADGGEETM